MSSLISGYEYDIFISYRQNDNKYDGWVTDFVANLNIELESTIKDKISTYFDANANDGLLETHHVDKSLAMTNCKGHFSSTRKFYFTKRPYCLLLLIFLHWCFKS